jgi:hypothetical protein
LPSKASGGIAMLAVLIPSKRLLTDDMKRTSGEVDMAGRLKSVMISHRTYDDRAACNGLIVRNT